MKIKKLSATFGKLKNSTLTLGEGMNVICAPNEYGKSTWCAFIKAMLYGIDTSDRDKAGYLADKTRYRPWDGGAMAGTMEIVHGGENVTLVRKAQGAAPMKGFAAYRTGTADFVSDVNGESAGEYFTGVPEHVFERTAFVRRPSIKVSQTPELEKRISILVATGEENVSYTDADKRLREQIRKLRNIRNGGTLPKLEEELDAAERRLAEVKKTGESLAELRELESRCLKKTEELEEDLKTHDKLDARSSARRIAEARARAKSAREEADDLRRRLTVNGHVVTRQDINSAREAAAAVQPLREIREKAVRDAWKAEQELSDAKSRMNASPLGFMTVEEAEANLARAEELEKGKVERENTPVPKTAVVMVVLGALLAALSLLGPVWASVGAVLGGAAPGTLAMAVRIAGGAVAALGAALILLRTMPKRDDKKAAEELAEIFKKCKTFSTQKLAELTREYALLGRECDTAAAAAAGAGKIRKGAEETAREAEETAARKIENIIPYVTADTDMNAEIEKLEQLIERLTKVDFEAMSAQSTYESMLDTFEGDPDAPEEYITLPIRNRADTETALASARERLADARMKYNIALGEQRSLGEAAVIEEKIQSLKDKIAAETRMYNALTLAADTLAEANTELQTRFSPIISQRAGEIMSVLTDGRYEKLIFDKGFEAGATAADDVVPRSALSLSEGTADEIYLALRLAMCQLILDGDEPCPIVLDDALANFDDKRCAAALAYLCEMAKERQVILFTCHSREAEMLKNTAANIIKA